MESKAWIEAVKENSAQFVEAVGVAGLEAPVPTCPAWTVADLVGHMGRVHRWVLGILETQAQESPGRPAGPDEGTDLLTWVQEGAERLVEALTIADPQTQVWNWAAGAAGPVEFWHRRMAHETAVHRVDAESAAGKSCGVEPPELAVDGLDELFELIQARFKTVARSPERTFHFHATDVVGEWHLRLTSDHLEVVRRHAKADVALRGPASDLELFAYNRGSADRLEIFGEPALLDEWRARMRF
ncbi:MAG: maleylpyruvate isomerase family mycothiol-dependent enzyme [Acidimicrobiia bacterium]